MKTRFGFVSNSSTSSFCIYGATFSRGDYEHVYETAEDAGLEVYYSDEYCGVVSHGYG